MGAGQPSPLEEQGLVEQPAPTCFALSPSLTTALCRTRLFEHEKPLDGQEPVGKPEMKTAKKALIIHFSLRPEAPQESGAVELGAE